MENMSKKVLMNVVLPIVAIVAVVLAGYFYSQVRELKLDPQVAAQKEAAKLTERVGKLILLPEEEVPTVATVSDIEALKDQLFFAKAQIGDKVLIYTEAKTAILYSVALDKVINVAPLNIGTQKAVTPPAPKDSEEPKL